MLEQFNLRLPPPTLPRKKFGGSQRTTGYQRTTMQKYYTTLYTPRMDVKPKRVGIIKDSVKNETPFTGKV